MGYAILEWYGGNDPIEGSQLVGDYEGCLRTFLILLQIVS